MVDHEQHTWHFKLARDLNRHARAFKVLRVGPQHDNQGVYGAHRQQGFFVQAGVGVDEQGIQAQCFAQFMEAASEALRVITLAQNLGHRAGVEAGGHQEQPASDLWTELIGEVHRQLFELAIAKQIVVEREPEFFAGLSQQQVQRR